MTQPSMKSPRNFTNYYTEVKSSVIRQKGESQNGCFKKTKHAKFYKKRIFLTRTCAYQGARNIRFSENLACFIFLKHPFWDSAFCLITDEIQLRKTTVSHKQSNIRTFVCFLIFSIHSNISNWMSNLFRRLVRILKKLSGKKWAFQKIMPVAMNPI